jgi:hypothetical protein
MAQALRPMPSASGFVAERSNGSLATPAVSGSPERHSLPRLLTLTLCAFDALTSQMLPVELLPLVGERIHDHRVSGGGSRSRCMR